MFQDFDSEISADCEVFVLLAIAKSAQQICHVKYCQSSDEATDAIN